MTRGTSSRRTAAGRTPPTPTPPSKRPSGGSDAKKTGSSFSLGLYKKNGALNWNRIVVYLVSVLALIALLFPFWRGIAFPDPFEVDFAALTPEERLFVRTLPDDQLVLVKQMVKTDPAKTSDTLAALQKPPITWTEGVPPGSSRIFAQGTFNRLDALRGAAGTVTIYKVGDLTFLRLEEFSLTNGPELHILLSPELNPTDATDMSSARDMGALKGTAGNILYPVQGSLVGYQSVVIYDVKYKQLYSAASLTYR